jgi:aryl-alcohol dehydrogenase-like predicted oxidoreductase
MAPVQPMHCLGQFNRKARLVAGMRPTPAPAHAGPHDAAYRYVRHEPGVDVVLFGTGDVGHLWTNIASILKPPLPAAGRAKLQNLFSHLRGVGLEASPARTA